MERQKLTVEQFKLLIVRGDILPGDCVLYVGGHPGLVGKLIGRVQRRLLRDLLQEKDCFDGKPIKFSADQLAQIDEAAAYTHVGTVIDADREAGMLPPMAQTRTWEQALPAGTVVTIRRPRYLARYDTESARGNRIKQHALADVVLGTAYPTSELLGYWLWSWGTCKLLMRRPFSRVFSHYREDVCSGRYWRWMQQSWAVGDLLRNQNDQLPEAWYPARLWIDRDHLVDIIEFQSPVGSEQNS